MLKEIPSENYNCRIEPLYVPEFDDLCSKLSKALSEDYNESDVEVVECPDLREWNISQEGLGGRSLLTDHGGEPFNHDTDYNQIVKFDIRKIAEALGFTDGAAHGSGACSSEVIDGHWGELTFSANLKEKKNSSVSSRVDAATHKCIVEKYDSLMHGGICNLHFTDGLPGKVIRIRAKGRVGKEKSLSQTLRRGLLDFDKPVGLGGVFRVIKGNVKAHVQPDLCNCPENYYSVSEMKCIKPFLQFYEGQTAMGPDLICLSVLWSKDPTGGAMHLRPSGEHTHFFSLSDKKEAGHYHGDDSSFEPHEEIEYEGYFVCAENIARIRDAYAEKLADIGEKPNICVVGAGAMGCLFGGLLSEGGLNVTLVDKLQEHVEKINQKGLKMVGLGGDRTIKINATTDTSKLDKFDVIIIQCKATQTKEAVESVKNLFHEKTIAISFQNGLGNEDVMSEVLGEENVFGGQTLQGANIEGPGKVRIHTNLVSYIGEWSGSASDRCARLSQIFSSHGLPTQEDTFIKKKIWMKVIYNCVVSPLSTLTNLAHKDIYSRKDAIVVANSIIKETIEVARAEGLEITDEEGRECLDKVIASNQSNKSSMCVDVLQKRKSEMDFINGRILSLAEKHKIDVPMNRFLVFSVKALESHFTRF